MNWTVPNTESLLRRLTKPKGKIDVVLDTDTYNELDDQFALSYMINPYRQRTAWKKAMTKF